MSVVTISGQAGSGYTDFGERLAKGLDYKLVDRQVFKNVLKEYGFVNFGDILDTPPHLFDRFGGEKHEAVDLLNKMYLSFAKQDNVVIVSRRAYLVLYKFINVLNVFLESPFADRVDNVMIQRGIDKEKAEEIVKQNENVRIKLIEAFYEEKWDSFLPFSLVVNTHKIGLDLTEKIIIEAASRLGTQEHHIRMEQEKSYHSIDSIETDPILEEVIKKVLFNK